MADDEEGPRISEPKPVTCHLVDGVTIEVREEFIRVVGWIDLQTVEMRRPERRIVVRAALPRMVVLDLIRDLGRAVSKVGH